jgi:hypothetical protein
MYSVVKLAVDTCHQKNLVTHRILLLILLLLLLVASSSSSVVTKIAIANHSGPYYVLVPRGTK